jgi:hypothetical protein
VFWMERHEDQIEEQLPMTTQKMQWSNVTTTVSR